MKAAGVHFDTVSMLTPEQVQIARKAIEPYLSQGKKELICYERPLFFNTEGNFRHFVNDTVTFV